MEVEPGRRRSAGPRGPLAEPAGLRPAARLRAGGRRLARGPDVDRRCKASSPTPRPTCRVEGWILWRRIGGGLAAGQQQALADPLLGPVRSLHRQLTTGKGRGGDFGFAIARNGRNLAAAGLAGTAAAGSRKSNWARCCWICCRSERWSRCGRRWSGPSAGSGPGCRSTGR